MMLIFASGNGSNFEALAKAFPSKISALITNVEFCGATQRAVSFSIPVQVLPHENYKSRAEHEIAIIKIIQKYPKIKGIVLAGYMRVLSPVFFTELNKLRSNLWFVNLHPAYLDDYKGAYAYKYAIEHKYPRWGISIHHVTEALDSGAVIATSSLSIYPWESLNSFKQRAQNLEHELIIKTISKLILIKE